MSMESFKTIEDARRCATRLSRECKCDVGIEGRKEFGHQRYQVSLLPRPENRCGWELRCEVVKPTDPAWL